MRHKQPHRTRRFLLILIGILVLGGIWSADLLARTGIGPDWLQSLFTVSEPGGGLRVGLIAGHKGNDSGAVCPDGLTEAEVNLDVAERVAARLRAQGLRVDILDEYDARLRGYRGAALVSIHADSCSVALSGFKVAPPDGGSPAAQRLATCLWDSYEAATGLPRHPNTITRDMTRYHAFDEIAVSTPAAIIETGFLNADREVLIQEADRVAAGIAEGVRCFLMAGESAPR